MVYADGMRVLVGAEGEFTPEAGRSVLIANSVFVYIRVVSVTPVAAAALGLGAFHGAADGAGGEECYC